MDMVEMQKSSVMVGEASAQRPICSEVNDILGEMDINPTLSNKQTVEVRRLVERHLEIFSRDDLDVGFCPSVQHQIPLEDNDPIRLPQEERRAPPPVYRLQTTQCKN